MARVRFWPKGTLLAALHMSAFGRKADIRVDVPLPVRGISPLLSRLPGWNEWNGASSLGSLAVLLHGR